MRAGHASDFFIDVLCGDLEVRRFRQQIADFQQKRLVGSCVVGVAGIGLMPGVDTRLEFISFGEQGFVLGRELVDERIGTGPECSGVEACSGNGLVVHEIQQDVGDLQATDLNVFSHCLPHSAQLSALQS